MKSKFWIPGILSMMLSGCAPLTRQQISESNARSLIDSILYLASLAGNSHNTQPWKVELLPQNHFRLYADTTRKLKVVDASGRGVFISLGAFIENFEQAAGIYGYTVQTEYKALRAEDILVAEMVLIEGTPSGLSPEVIKDRRTLRGNFSVSPLQTQDLEHLLEGTQGVHYYPLNSREGKYIAEMTVQAYTQQATHTKAQAELQKWIRFSNRDAAQHQDGLTTAGMEIRGLAGFMVSRFFSPEDSRKSSFVRKGIDKTSAQVNHCGGWIVITGAENRPADWLKTGQTYEKINLRCRGLKLGIHPMNQILEEKPYEDKAAEFLNLEGTLQFIARIGYTETYPEAVSLRRKPEEFILPKAK